MSGTKKMLSVTVVAAVLVATVAVARTVHTRAAAMHVTTGSVISAASGRTTTPLHGIVACPTAVSADCEKLEMMLPM